MRNVELGDARTCYELEFKSKYSTKICNNGTRWAIEVDVNRLALSNGNFNLSFIRFQSVIITPSSNLL